MCNEDRTPGGGCNGEQCFNLKLALLEIQYTCVIAQINTLHKRLEK